MDEMSCSGSDLASGGRFYGCYGSDSEGGEKGVQGNVRQSGKSISSYGGARCALKNAKEREEDEEFLRELDRRAFLKAPRTSAGTSGAPVAEVDVEKLGADALITTAEANLREILDLTGRSTNLKGGYASKIRKAAGSIREILESLVSRTEDEETRRLRADNGRLQREVANLREEVRAHRREFEEMRKEAAKQKEEGRKEFPMSNSQLEVLEKGIAKLVGNLVDGRLAGLEARLPPPPVMRPPLAGDNSRVARETRAAIAEHVAQKRKAEAPARVTPAKVATTVATKSRTAESVVLSSSEDEFPALGANRRKKAPKKKTDKKEVAWTAFGPSTSKAIAPQARRPAPAAEAQKTKKPATAEEGWSTVVRRKAPPKKSVSAKPTTTKTSEPPKAKLKLKLPSSSAVVLKLKPEAERSGATYCSALLKAEQEVDLAGLGIGPLRIRQSATGARLLEIPGASSQEKADVLADKLRVALSEVVEVSRPVKKADFRLTGLDDAATADRIKAAVAKEGGCSPDQVWVGDIRPDFRAAHSALMRCPVAAGKKLLQTGALMVGWSKVRIQHLAERPMHCYRCMGKGHTATMCPSTKDRSGLCYRCGQAGHISAGCKEPIRCAVCADAGLKADHVMGGRFCTPPSTRGKKAPSSTNVETRALSAAQEAEMSE